MEPETTQEEQLTRYANQAFDMFLEAWRSCGASNKQERKEIPRSVAYCIGAHAARKKIPLKKVKQWLQKSYGAIWVKKMDLIPEWDLKEIFTAINNAYNLATKRTSDN